jgi:hypothetical protein
MDCTTTPLGAGLSPVRDAAERVRERDSVVVVAAAVAR